MERSHLIGSAEVDAWLSDSVVTVVTTHCTDRESAQDIVERGVDIQRSRFDAAWWRGFYSRTPAAPQYGEVHVPVAVRLLNPLILHDSVRGAAVVDDLANRAGTDDFRSAIMSAGFDGVLIHMERRWSSWLFTAIKSK